MLVTVGFAPLGEGTLPDVLDASKEPAFLLFEGKIAFANISARQAFGAEPPWMGRLDLAAYARVQPLKSAGRSLTLVLPWISTDVSGVDDALPPALRRTASLIARGLSDKEIAQALDLSHATVRTYVTRIYERLGISDRRQLMLPQRR